MNSLKNVRFINEHNEIVNEPNEIMVVHDILSQKMLQRFQYTNTSIVQGLSGNGQELVLYWQ